MVERVQHEGEDETRYGHLLVLLFTSPHSHRYSRKNCGYMPFASRCNTPVAGNNGPTFVSPYIAARECNLLLSFSDTSSFRGRPDVMATMTIKRPAVLFTAIHFDWVPHLHGARTKFGPASENITRALTYQYDSISQSYPGIQSRVLFV